MAAMGGRPVGSRNKPKGEEKALDKYMIGGEEMLKKGLEKIFSEIEGLRKEMRGDMERLKEQMGRREDSKRRGKKKRERRMAGRKKKIRRKN